MTTKTTSLLSTHQRLGAKCINFAGFNMPVWYSTQKEEHLSVRKNVGMFDISHMGLYKISGKNSDSFISTLSCNNIRNSLNEKMIYSMLLNENGMILDDVMFGKLNDEWLLVVNASNNAKIEAWMNTHKPDGVTIASLNKSHSFIAVQGPNSEPILNSLFKDSFSSLKKFKMTQSTYNKQSCMITRTGYTGEDGFEIIIPNEHAEEFWNQLLNKNVTPCGLAARDGLRIEFGLPLYGQELSESIHPFMTRYDWVVKFDHEFIGKEALKKLSTSVTFKACGLELLTPMIARTNYSIEEGGYITSGTISPITNKSIAMALVDPKYAIVGTKLHVLIRKQKVEAKVVDVPFL